MQTIITLFASCFGLFAFIKYFLLIEMRIDENSFKVIYDTLLDSNKKFIIEEEFTNGHRYPVVFNCFSFTDKYPYFYLSHEERLMNAGWEAKDHVNKVLFFRWNYKKIKWSLAKSHELLSDIPVELIAPGYSDKIGKLKKSNFQYVVLNPLCLELDKDVAAVSSAKKLKTGGLLYGPPGNGKTSFVKYLSLKYNMSIKIITFNPDWNNHDLLLLFSQIPKNCIVLFEDFDNYFDGRKCIVGGGENKNIKFTFDIILNGLDGIYNNYENVVFIMTTNDINKIDSSLKNRPSRFKYVIEFYNPKFEERIKLLGSEEYAQKTEGLNLDQIIRIKESLEEGCFIEKSIAKIYND